MKSNKQKMFKRTGYGNLEDPHPKNIFSYKSPQGNELQRTMYSIVGDQEFRKKYLSLNHGVQQQKIENVDKIEKQVMIQSLPLKKTTTKNRNIKINCPLKRHKFYSSKWGQFNNSVMKNFAKVSIIKNTIPQLYIHPNPQRLDLINDNIPQYWVHSLRNNYKKIKSFIKGHNFKEQEAQQMLQTYNGTKFLQSSIPKIKSQWTDKSIQKYQILKVKPKHKILSQTLTSSKIESLPHFQEVYKINYPYRNNRFNFDSS